MQFSTILAAAVLSFAAQPDAQHGNTGAPAQHSYADSLNHALSLARNGDCAGALEIMAPALSSPSFQALSAESMALVHETIIECGIDQRRWTETLASIDALLALRGNTKRLLWLKILIADITDQPLASLDATKTLAVFSPETLSAVELRTIFSLMRKLEETEAGDKRLEFLDLLWDAAYHPSDPAASLDGLRMTYARLLRDEHLTARAASLIREVESPQAVADFLIDRRFDPVRNFRDLPILQDLPEMMDAYVAGKHELRSDHPQLLSAALSYVQALRLAGAFVEAEAAASEIAAKMGDSADASPYEDFDEQAPWLLNEWAYALYDLGQYEAGRATLSRAAAMNESGAPNVSQRINLSTLLLTEGRFDDALSEIAEFDPEFASPYGVMWAKMIVVCARAFQGRLYDAEDELAYIRTHGDDNISALQRTLFCINDLDAAAALYVERLNDPELRSAALGALQTTLSPPHAPPYRRELETRFEAVKARADVQAAAREVGRLLRFPFYSVYWGDV